jgi:hypothetical protein
VTFISGLTSRIGRMSTWERGRNGEAALDLVEDDALDLLAVVEGLFELAPALLAARLVAGQDRLAQRVFDTLQIDLDGVADLEVVLAARTVEFTQRHASFGLQAYVDDGEVLFNSHNGAFDDSTFLQIAVSERVLQHRSKIIPRGRGSGR